MEATKLRRRFRLKKIKTSRVLLYIFVILMVCFTALPLVYVVTTAFKPLSELYLFPPKFFTQNPTLTNFRDLLYSLDASAVPFTRYIFNSLFVSVLVVALNVMVSCAAAYGMVKHRIPFGNVVFGIIVAALMFSPQVTQIPTYMIVNSMGLIDTIWSLIIPKIAVAYNVFLIKQFVEQLPDAFLEAARLDGAGEFKIFCKIAMPFLRPAWSALIVFTFVSNWNDYSGPLIFITSDQLKTLPLALQTIGSGGSIARAGAMSAATFLMTIPTVLIYTLMQKKVIETMTYSGIK